MTFDACIAKLLKLEGGFVDHPSDPGGATNFGITQAVARANGYQGHMRDLPLDTAKQIYKKLYWDAVGIVNLPPDVQFTVFDAAVNAGPKQAAKWLQR
jgi:lysozyme family protein